MIGIISKMIFLIALIFTVLIVMGVVFSLIRMLILLLIRHKNEETERTFGEHWINIEIILFNSLKLIIPTVILWIVYFRFFK